MSTERLKLGDVEIHQRYLQVSHASVACLNALRHHRFGSGISRKWGWADYGLPKNWQEICWKRLCCMDYEQLVVNSKAGVMIQTYLACVEHGPTLLSKMYANISTIYQSSIKQIDEEILQIMTMDDNIHKSSQILTSSHKS